jgi:D-lactate dehydrogenase (cytochrome)
MDVVVQPSVPWMSLNDQIKDSGLFFPVDPGPSVSNKLPKDSVSPKRVTRGTDHQQARIGGMVGTSCR